MAGAVPKVLRIAVMMIIAQKATSTPKTGNEKSRKNERG